MKRIILAALVGVLVCGAALSLPSPAAAGFDEGVAAHERGDYATALREFRPLAERGLAEAQANLGMMFEKGQGVPQSHAEAVKWYRRSANRGSVVAQNGLGYMYDKGQGVLLGTHLGLSGQWIGILSLVVAAGVIMQLKESGWW